MPVIEPQQSKFSDFRPKLLRHMKRALCVLLNTLDTLVSIQSGRKLSYALPKRTENEKHQIKDSPIHANQLMQLKFLKKLMSYKII